MEINRFIVRLLLEVVRELCYRLGHHDLVVQCDECVAESKAMEEAEKKEG